MLTVWCVFTGNKYPIQYVYNLRKMVRNQLTRPHRFLCITDRVHIPLIDTVQSLDGLPGWWQKLALFHYATGPSLYFDIDSLIVRSIAPLLEFTRHKLAMSRNWWQSGHGGWQSSCMAWDGSLKKPISEFKYQAIDKHWGDQEYLSEVMGNCISEIPAGLLCSYKYHCRGGLPPNDAIAVTFHGKPDYHEVRAPWIDSALRVNGQRAAVGA